MDPEPQTPASTPWTPALRQHVGPQNLAGLPDLPPPNPYPSVWHQTSCLRLSPQPDYYTLLLSPTPQSPTPPNCGSQPHNPKIPTTYYPPPAPSLLPGHRAHLPGSTSSPPQTVYPSPPASISKTQLPPAPTLQQPEPRATPLHTSSPWPDLLDPQHIPSCLSPYPRHPSL